MDLHLKKIEINGFKSFADKVEIDFKKGITAIVGPNGSGKSNIADAIRWVLGEQSIKTLRGSKMEDVIFSGTDKRRALGYSEVTITFDNNDKVIPLDYGEVAITRRMFRSGESEYYINKNSCRLKDIRELFMDTGVGKEGYSIIGQGKVDEVLSTRPEERRKIFEEAAGIVKYKTRKIEAEKKLEKTDQNIVRIKDLIHELTIQSDNLKEQSEKAHVYLKLSNRLKEIEINLLIREFERLNNLILLNKDEKEKLKKQMDELINRRNEVECNFNMMKNKISELDISMDMIERERSEALNSLNERNNHLSLLEEKEKYLQRDIERLVNEIEGLNSKLEDMDRKKTQLIDERSKLLEELSLLKKEFHNKNIKLQMLKDQILLKEREIEVQRDNAIEVYNAIRDKKSKINSFASFKDNIYRRMNQVENEIKSLLEKVKENEQLLEWIEKEEEVKAKEIDKEKEILYQLKLLEKEHNDKLDYLYKDINGKRAELQGKVSNYNLLKTMEQDYEGYYKSVKNLMLECRKKDFLREKIIGVVADLMRVDEEYEKAIDVGLSGSLQNVVTKNEEDAKYVIEYLRENNLGRVTFLPLTTIKGKPLYISPKDREKYNILGLGSELINFDEEYRNIFEYLLGKTIIVKDLRDALILAKKYNYAFKIVTLKGDIINAGGSMTGGSFSKASTNLINRRARIVKIEEEIKIFNKALDDLEDKKRQLKTKILEIQANIKVQEESLQNKNIEFVRIENEKNKAFSQLEDANSSLSKYFGEMERLKIELDNLVKEEKVLKEELDLIDLENNKSKEIIKEMISDFEEIKVREEEASKEVTDVKIQLNNIENRLANKEEMIESTKKEIDNNYYLIKVKEEELKKNKEEIKALADERDNIRDEIIKFTNCKEEKEEALMDLKTKKSLLMKDYYLKQDSLNELNNQINEQSKLLNNCDIKEAKYNVQLENINTKLKEDYELNYEEAQKFRIPVEDENKVKEEARKIKNEIKDIGSVNLASIEDYKKIKERLDFICKQHEDLLLSKENLLQVINDMEKKMKEQFLYNFNKINVAFDEIFSALFGGGKASIELEDEKDILNCGIEIKAQPPGKKLQSLSLLSGGEKSLTAVALLFAILKIKPTPFCVLDEIDAALDEANISRYTNYLRSFSEDTQFIIITHRKSTMEMADILYGVTMEEEGVSKIVSVKLTDNTGEIAS